MRFGAVLIHGFSGLPEDLARLEDTLRRLFGGDSITSVALPGHTPGVPPVFREKECIDTVIRAIDAFRSDGREVILIGHSTGGVIALAALAELSVTPRLLVLAASPRKIGMDALARWERHRTGRESVPFSAMAGLVSLVNRVGERACRGRFPVLVLHGEQDDLVPAAEAGAWEDGPFEGPVRTLLIPAAGHHLFQGTGGGMSVDLVARAVRDAAIDPADEDEDVVRRIIAVEPEAERFLQRSPFSRIHLARSASGKSVIGRVPELSDRSGFEPVIANIEITTRCNLSCAYCARSFREIAPEDMPVARFRRILDLLPHAFHVTLVGLGEPLLHPGLTECVSLAAGQGRRVGLVTNAVHLDRGLAEGLLRVGLSSIAFSIDAPDQELASELRPGTDFPRVLANITGFLEAAKAYQGISTAVFTAVSRRTLPRLDDLIDIVANLGVHVMMVTDLNFEENRRNTLWESGTPGRAEAVRKAVARAFMKKLPVLSVHGLEEFGLMTRYGHFLLIPPDSLFQRSKKRTWCCSPWQTIPVNVHGEATLCDCQPDRKIGNLLEQPFDGIWNGDAMQEYRRQMLSGAPPKCLLCPRF